MTALLERTVDRGLRSLRALADRPLPLLVLLLLANALARPYAGLVHDARLYSVQTLNRLSGGAFADDLFFRFGSQDRFSVFSHVAAPLAALVGIDVAFFVLYLAFNALFVLALSRFVLALLEDRAAAVLALFFLVVAPLPFGGLNIFFVHEPFCTPRLLANALVLFALERLLRHRFGTAFGLLLAALVMHPLMAFGGLLVAAGYGAIHLLPRRLLLTLTLVAVLLGLTVLALPALGTALFGTMDDDWRAAIRAASVYNFPDEWEPTDWLNIGVCFLVPLLALATLDLNERVRRLLGVLVAVGAAGLLGTVYAAQSPYALLFQGQPYRVLWLLKVVQVPLGFALIARLLPSPAPTSRLAGFGLLAFFTLTNYLGIELFLPLLILPLAAMLVRDPRQPWLDRVFVPLTSSLLVGAVLWAAFKEGLLLANRERLALTLDPHEVVRLLLWNVGPLVWLLLAAALAVGAAAQPRRATLLGVVAVAALQLLWFVVPGSTAYREHATRHGRDVAFVRDVLAARNVPHATVYAPLGRVDYLWLDWSVNSWFDPTQVVGALFSRRNALEGARRAAVAGPFAWQPLRRDVALLPTNDKRSAELLFGPPPQREPDAADLARLCRQEGVEVVVLDRDFPGLSSANNGRLFVYETQRVRAALGLPSVTAVAAR